MVLGLYKVLPVQELQARTTIPSHFQVGSGHWSQVPHASTFPTKLTPQLSANYSCKFEILQNELHKNKIIKACILWHKQRYNTNSNYHLSISYLILSTQSYIHSVDILYSDECLKFQTHISNLSDLVYVRLQNRTKLSWCCSSITAPSSPPHSPVSTLYHWKLVIQKWATFGPLFSFTLLNPISRAAHSPTPLSLFYCRF